MLAGSALAFPATTIAGAAGSRLYTDASAVCTSPHKAGVTAKREDRMRIRMHRICAFALISWLSLFLFTTQAAVAAAPTTTILKVTSADSLVADVASGSVVTLTATVKSKAGAVTVGQVRFCDAASAYCTDIHLLGLSQLTSAGTAVLRFVPGIGKHSYKAVFAGTPNGSPAYAGSASKKVPLAVTGKFPTATSITASGGAGDYTLTATVTGFVNATSLASPAGKASFIDTSDSNHVLGKASLGAGTLGLGFFNSSSPPTHPYAQYAAVGDFNGDGLLDLAVPVYSIATSAPDVDIFLGNGDGTFKAGPTFPLANQNVNNAAVGDFNGDGIPDLAISLPDAGQVQVLLGNGDGSFTPMAPISDTYVARVVTADLNGDGKADLIVAGYEVTILLGNGDGTFTAGQTIPITGGGYSVAVGDFNGDGIPDLAIPNNSGSETSPSSVTILLGKGDGTFTALSQSPQTGIEPLWIAAGDFNGDGFLDLAVTNMNQGYPNLGTVTVLLGHGDGTFAPTAVSPQTGSIPYSIAVADFNGDGKADLVTSNAGSNTLSVLLGNGDGTFTAALSPSAGTNPQIAGVGDFNGDGLPDVAAPNNYPKFTVTVLLTEETQTATATATGISPQGSGQHLVDATYKGNAIYKGSTSPTVPLTGSDAARP